MLRDKLFKSRADENAFRTRGGDVKRIEGFSDALFAFAVTLLIISLEVPKTFNELLMILRDFPAFVLSCLLLLVVWRLHYNYFRRYGLEDSVTISLNGILLIVVLFFIYPLKFLFTFLTYSVLGIDTRVMLSAGEFLPMLDEGQTQLLLIIYGAGYIAVFGVFALLYWHAYNMRRDLELDPFETFLTRDSVMFNGAHVSIAVVSIVLVLVLPLPINGFAGMAYILVWPLQFFRDTFERRRRDAWQQQQADAFEVTKN